ncbi:MAG: hypothetical protein LBE98_01960 [Puniceicoccales bacterium]|jgi:hypothetical protein|nr:hypothetical protein [Puniceicoccales bacterium]
MDGVGNNNVSLRGYRQQLKRKGGSLTIRQLKENGFFLTTNQRQGRTNRVREGREIQQRYAAVQEAIEVAAKTISQDPVTRKAARKAGLTTLQAKMKAAIKKDPAARKNPAILRAIQRVALAEVQRVAREAQKVITISSSSPSSSETDSDESYLKTNSDGQKAEQKNSQEEEEKEGEEQALPLPLEEEPAEPRVAQAQAESPAVREAGQKAMGAINEVGNVVQQERSQWWLWRVCQTAATFVGNLFKPSSNCDFNSDPVTVADQVEETDQTKAEKIAKFTAILNAYVSDGIKISKLQKIMPEIKNTLDIMQTFVRKNNLSPNEISTLRAALVNFSGNEEVIQLCPDQSSSIKASDCNQYCFEIASRVEAIEILLDAKKRGYVRLEENGPSRVFSCGQYNAVQLAYTKRGEQGPTILKSCDQCKLEQNFEESRKDAGWLRTLVGRGGGSYSRNKATSRVQDILRATGQKNGVNVPYVIASVFAAEMKGQSCIAMPKLQGHSVWAATRENKVRYDNNFIRRDTWIQLQDVLTGQIDRHGNNEILTKYGPVAIDHDLSFPTVLARSFAGTIPNSIRSYTRGPVDHANDGITSKNYCMPPVIDEDMYKVIMAMDLDELKSIYQECGLTRYEITPALARAQALKKKVEKLKQRGSVIKSDEWEQSEKVKTLCTPDNFYALLHYDGR